MINKTDKKNRDAWKIDHANNHYFDPDCPLCEDGHPDEWLHNYGHRIKHDGQRYKLLQRHKKNHDIDHQNTESCQFCEAEFGVDDLVGYVRIGYYDTPDKWKTVDPINWLEEHKHHYSYTNNPDCPHCHEDVRQEQAVIEARRKLGGITDNDDNYLAARRMMTGKTNDHHERKYETYRVRMKYGKVFDISVPSGNSPFEDLRLRLGKEIVDVISYHHIEERQLEVELYQENEWRRKHRLLQADTILWFEAQRKAEWRDKWQQLIKNLANAFQIMYEWETYVFKPLTRKSPIEWIHPEPQEKK